MHAIFYDDDFSKSYVPYILQEIYIHGVYAPFLTGRQEGLIVDAGANIGLTSSYFSQHAARVIAVEPATKHRECMSAMLAFNSITNVEIAPVALAGHNGQATLHHSANVTAHSLVPFNANSPSSEEVTSITLENLMSIYEIEHINLLKLDVEGVEGEIVKSDSFAKIAPKIDVIVGEWHEWGSMPFDEFLQQLASLGFDTWRINGVAAHMFIASRIPVPWTKENPSWSGTLDGSSNGK